LARELNINVPVNELIYNSLHGWYLYPTPRNFE
jgi:hypothetical protein